MKQKRVMCQVCLWLPVEAGNMIRHEAKRRRVKESVIAREVIDRGLGLDDNLPKDIPLAVKEELDHLKRTVWEQGQIIRHRDG